MAELVKRAKVVKERLSLKLAVFFWQHHHQGNIDKEVG